MGNIFYRISDVISANLNDLIDKVEDPERMIKQVIREMEDNIRNAKEGVVDAIASEKQLFKELSSHRGQAGHWHQRAEQALRDGNEALAREALARKQEHDSVVRSMEPSWASARNTSDKLKAQLRSLERKLEEAQRKKGGLVARKRAAQAREHMDRTRATFETGLDTEAKFDRMENRVGEMEARVEAMEELSSEQSELERQFQQMETNQDVERELAALKKQLERN